MLRIHGRTEEETSLGKYLLKFMTKTLELDLNSLHVAFKSVFGLSVILVLYSRKHLKEEDARTIRQEHFKRKYRVERRLTRLKIVPREARVAFFRVSISRHVSHSYERFERIAMIRLEDTYLRYLHSGRARNSLTTITPPYKLDGRLILPCEKISENESKRTAYAARDEEIDNGGRTCYELRRFGRCSFIDRDMKCMHRHPKYLSDKNVIRPCVRVSEHSETGVSSRERITRRCSICTLPLESQSRTQDFSTTNHTSRGKCERCKHCRIPMRAFTMPRGYTFRPSAMFQTLAHDRGIRTGVLHAKPAPETRHVSQ